MKPDTSSAGRVVRTNARLVREPARYEMISPQGKPYAGLVSPMIAVIRIAMIDRLRIG